MRVGVVTLGCDKNTVDSERYLAQLAAWGAEPAGALDDADLIIINTCGFIDAAKRESIDAIVDAGRLKAEGRCQAVVAVGCLVQRHKAELAAELPEVDLFLGASEMDQLVPLLSARGLLAEAPMLHPGDRLYAGDLPHVRYLKISEGCDHGCAFCAIPLMRGRHRSFAVADVVREAQLLEAQGAREVNLVAQDLAHFGRDRRDGAGLPELLEALCRETTVPWIRMLYLYSAGITPRLLEVVARESRILPYLDMPIQHASDAMLARMRRPERKKTIREKVQRFRDAVPDVAIRTTCIVGFPGETEDDFQQLVDFLEEVQFDRVGGFTYSAQEGTHAATMPDDVPESLKQERLERLSDVQRAVTGERYERLVGRIVPALVDRATGSDGRVGSEARTAWQADDIDGITLLDRVVAPGTLVEARIEAVVDDYDFRATVVSEISAPHAAPSLARQLPVLTTTIGSFGR